MRHRIEICIINTIDLSDFSANLTPTSLRFPPLRIRLGSPKKSVSKTGKNEGIWRSFSIYVFKRQFSLIFSSHEIQIHKIKIKSQVLDKNAGYIHPHFQVEVDVM